MPRFESSRGRERGFRDSRPRRDNRSRRDFDDNPRGGRDRFSRGRDRQDVEMTKVICSSCGDECEVPFKPSSSKPVYCNDCFAKKGKGGSSSNVSEKDIEQINEKLDKIMQALKIE
jgi:CxxC-x17-CxxC domain-containing protein